MSIIIAGFLLGISLIVAIGPQNALVIRQGIKRQAVGVVLTVCIISDIILTTAGTAGVGALVDRAPIALTILKWLGATYLAWFGYNCFKDAFATTGRAIEINSNTPHNDSTSNSTQHPPTTETATPSRAKVATPTRTIATTTTTPKAHWLKPVLAALAFTWLNPATYIDTLVMLGGIANQHGEDGRWLFCLGALMASFLWFPLLGIGAIKFSRVLSQPQAWRAINFTIGCIMVIMCIRLVLH